MTSHDVLSSSLRLKPENETAIPERGLSVSLQTRLKYIYIYLLIFLLYIYIFIIYIYLLGLINIFIDIFLQLNVMKMFTVH